MIESSLNGIFQGKKKILRSYIDMFTQVDVEVDGGQRGPSVVDLREWPYMGPSLQVKDNEKESENHQEMLTMPESYMLLKEKLTTCFNNPASTKTHFVHSSKNESHRRRDESD